MTTKLPTWKYPQNWKKASQTLRRIVGRCERCGRESDHLSVHHLGADYITGLPGDPRDKHDLRRENLQVICYPCHDELDGLTKMKKRIKRNKKRRQARLAAHQSLGIGTGLVPVGVYA